MLVLLYKKTLLVSISYRILHFSTNNTVNHSCEGVCFDGMVLLCDHSTHTAPHGSEPTRCQYACAFVCWILTPLCEGHPEVLRWLVEGPELGVSPFCWGLMGSVGVRSVVCSMRFEVLCRSTKAGPSAPLVSPPSSLKCWTSLHRKKTWWMKLTKSGWDQTWSVWT